MQRRHIATEDAGHCCCKLPILSHRVLLAQLAEVEAWALLELLRVDL